MQEYEQDLSLYMWGKQWPHQTGAGAEGVETEGRGEARPGSPAHRGSWVGERG